MHFRLFCYGPQVNAGVDLDLRTLCRGRNDLFRLILDDGAIEAA